MPDALSRDRWTDAALSALASDGLEAVRVEPLARRLGVTKGSFYWHFRDRDELLEAMLVRWEQVATNAIIEAVGALTGPPGARLRAIFERVFTRRVVELEIAIREWGRRDARVTRVLRRVDRRRLRYDQDLLEELGFEPADAEARAFLGYSMLFGDHFIAAADGPERRSALLERCAALMTTPPSGGKARRRGG